MKRVALLSLAPIAFIGCQEASQPLTVEPMLSLEAAEASDSAEASALMEWTEAPMLFSLSNPLDGFRDDFEADLSQWVGKGGGAHHGLIVEDPLRPGNHVLTFTALNVGGDIFGPEVGVTLGDKHVLSFEYLGLPNGGLPGDLGGTIGFAEGLPSRHRWLAGTRFCCGIEAEILIDDGQWRTYKLEFDVFESGRPNQVFTFEVTPPSNNTIRVMLEDFPDESQGGVGGDAFFDNVEISIAPLLVDIDIKPGSDPSSWPCRDVKKELPVAILSTSDFDATTVDAGSVRFGKTGTEASEVHEKDGAAKRHVEDKNKDGLLDMVFHFRFGDTGFSCDDLNGERSVMLIGELTGHTQDGTPIAGEDILRLVKE